ncbi:MAG TPA: branched-chain amino acid ABC transporter permease [Planctomycetota bacterium]|nr:branched-chain amino acid ABC transporter permease [Planctomycetota bacterium]
MRRLLRADILLLVLAAALPLVDVALARAGLGAWQIGNEVCQRVLIFAILGLGLNVVVGYTGLLHLGVAAFMAIGVYAYAILTCEIYPYQVGFWWALVAAPAVCALAGVLLGSPTLRLRGDYLAIVTLGFGEIVQDVLKNVDVVTKGTQGINPLPPPVLPGYALVDKVYEPWYYLYLAILVGLVLLLRNLESSRIGRQWVSIREDELAATCMGVNPTKTKLLAFAIAAAISGLAGVLWAAKLATTAEPTTYDFNVSMTVLCICIVGGMGSIDGVLAGAGILMGFDIALKKITEALQRHGLAAGGENVFLTPTNWKYLIFGLALVLMMRFKPEGIFPSSRIREEMHEGEPS